MMMRSPGRAGVALDKARLEGVAERLDAVSRALVVAFLPLGFFAVLALAVALLPPVFFAAVCLGVVFLVLVLLAVVLFAGTVHLPTADGSSSLPLRL
jgi:protein-S-isoprenylcysteine O-methyltransferase Ste14